VTSGGSWPRRRSAVNVKRACELLKLSPAAYYATRRDQPSRRQRDDAALAAQVKAVQKESSGRYGAPRVHAQLRAQGHRHSRKRSGGRSRQARRNASR